MSNHKDLDVETLATLPEFTLKTFAIMVEDIAQDIEARFGIPHLIPIAQAAHESRNGNSGLARKYCNLFGITATKNWTDKGRPIAYLPTWEVIKGKRVDMKREFRAYSTWRESFEDWADIITRLSVYKNAYALMRAGEISRGIEEMGKAYASDPAYAKKLVGTLSLLGAK